MTMRFFCRGDFHHGQRGRGGGKVRDHVDLALVEPAARQVGRHVGLVLVVGEDQLDRLAQHLAAHFFDGDARRRDGALAREVGVNAGKVVEHADLHDVVADLGVNRKGREGGAGRQADGEFAKWHEGLHGLGEGGRG
jgi:hypothetical protein